MIDAGSTAPAPRRRTTRPLTLVLLVGLLLGSTNAGGMVADELDVRAVGPMIFTVGSSRNLVLDVGLPLNGSEGEVIERLNVVNMGTANAGEVIERIEAWADDGDQTYNPVLDTLLGTFVFTGDRWELTAIYHEVITDALRIYVTADITMAAAEGRTLQIGLPTLPDLGIGMVSGNDGPVDHEVFNPFAQAVSASDLIILAPGMIDRGSVNPGDTEIPLLHLAASNTYGDTRTLNALGVTNATIPAAAATTAELDATTTQLKLRHDGDGNGQLGDLIQDPIIATGYFAGGRATFTGLAWNLPPGSTRHLFITGDVSLTGTADGDVLGAVIASGLDLDFGSGTATSAPWPLSSAAAWTVDGFVLAQVVSPPVASLTLAASDGPVLALDVNVPSNGYASDSFSSLRLVNHGTATDTDLAELRLWNDGGDGLFDAGNGDDRDLGPLVWSGDSWRNPLISEPIGPGGLRLFVGLSVSDSPTDSTTVSLAIPIGGIVNESDNDGPIDGEVTSNGSFLLSTAPVLAQIQLGDGASVVGQTVTVSMRLQNVGIEDLVGVTPAELTMTGTGTLSRVDGPLPATLDLPAGDSATVTWTYLATTAGTLRATSSASGSGQDTGLPRESLPVNSSPHQVYDTIPQLDLFAVQNMPFSINRGQTDVVPLTLTFRNPGGALVTDAHLNGLRLSLEDGAGQGIVPADLLQRVVVNEGANVYIAKTDLETSGNEVVLDLAPVAVISGAEPTTLSISLDIAPDANVQQFRVAIVAASSLDASARIGGAPVPVQLQDTEFPFRTGLGRLLSQATGLHVASVPLDDRAAGEGQTGVSLMTLRLENPGDPQIGSDIKVGAFAVSVVDTFGDPLTDLHEVLSGMRVRSQVQDLLAIDFVAGDSASIHLELATLLTIPAGTPLEIEIAADIIATANPGPIRLQLDGAHRFEARDANTGTPVAITYVDGLVQGPIVTVQSLATELMAAGTPNLPASLTIGARSIPALQLALRHPGDPDTAPIRVDSLVFACRDEARRLQPPGAIIDHLQVLHDSLPVGAISDPGGDGRIAVSLNGVLCPAGATTYLTVALDIDSGAPTANLELTLDAAGIQAADANLALAVTVTPDSASEFPLSSGMARLLPPVDELLADFVSLMPPVLVEHESEFPVAEFVFSNAAQVASGSINLESLTIRARDRERGAVAIGRVATSLRLYHEDVLWGGVEDLAPSDTVATVIPLDTAVVGAGQSMQLELRMQVQSPATVAGFSLGVTESDIALVQPHGASLAIRVEPMDGAVFPFWSEVGNFTGAGLAESYSNFPNPFAAGREATTFAYALNRSAHVSLRLMTGHWQTVATLLDNEWHEAGLYQDLLWEGDNGRGVVVQNGVYVAELLVRYDDGEQQRVLRKVAVVR